MSACVKCGNEGSGNIYQQTYGGFGSSPQHETRFCWGPEDPKCAVIVAQRPPSEHLDKTCGTCGYTWAARCKDNQP